MQNSRLVQLLKIFTIKELKELKQFIECELFHSNKKQYKKVVFLFQKLISQRWKILTPQRRSLAIELFGSNSSSDRKLSLHISQAIDLTQKYLVYKYQTKEPLKYNQTLLVIFREKRERKLFNHLKGRVIRDLEGIQEKDSDYFFNFYQVAKKSLLLGRVRNRNLNIDNEDFRATIDNLGLFFLINQMSYACQILNIKYILRTKQEHYHFSLLKITVDKLSETPHFQLPIIQIYWWAYKLLETNQSKYYLGLKKLLFDSYDLLSAYYLANIIMYLQNYCATQINQGKHDYFSDFWEIYLFRLDKELLKELDIPTYKNLITTGVMLALKQEIPNFTEVLQFIQQHTDKLPSEYRGEAETYGQAYIAFYQNNLQLVPQKLIIIQEDDEQKRLIIYKFQDLYYKVDARRLLVMTYFRLEEDDNFEKMCSNLSVFLNERKDFIPEIEIEKNRQFLIHIRKVSKVYGSRREEQVKYRQIKKEIIDCPNISDRTWLLTQIESLLSEYASKITHTV